MSHPNQTQARNNPRARKRVECKFYAQGSCTKGTDCRYLHSSPAQTEPLRSPGPSIAQGLPRVTQPRPSNNGNSWRQRRNEAAIEATPSGSQTGGVEISNKKPCFDFRDGRCTRGADCKYSHNPRIREDELRRLQALTQEEERRKEARQKAEEEERERREKAAEAERLEQERIRRVREQEAKERQRVEQARRKREQKERQAREREQAERARQEREARERVQRELAERQKREREAAATIQVVVGDSNLVTFAAGFETRAVIPGFNLCAVVVRNLPLNAGKGDVVEVFRRDLEMNAEQFHVADIVFDNGTKKATVLTRTENTTGIEERALGGIAFRDQLLEFQLGANAMWGKMNSSAGGGDPNTLTVQWNSPSKTMILTYTTMEETRRMARELDGTMLGNRKIRAAVNTMPAGAAARFFVPESVKVTSLDPSVGTLELVALGGTDRIREVNSGHVYDQPSCIRSLETRLRVYGALDGSFEATPMEHHRMQARVRFSSPEAAQRVADAIENGTFGRNPPFRAFLPKGHQFTISIIRPQYESQKSLWDELAEGSNRKGAFVRVSEGQNNGRMYIKVLGSNQQEVGALKVRVESLVVGERLGTDYWHSSFLSTAGAAFLRTLKESTGAFASVDRKVQALRLFGTGAAKTAAKEEIQEEVERLNFLEWSIPLPRQSVAFFVRSGLKTLQDALGEENVSLNLSSQPATIKIKGGDDARHHLRKLTDEATELCRLGTAVPQSSGGGVGTCPICYDDVASPDTLSCGHSYCEGCLRHYLTSAADSKTFPLVCMGAEATCRQSVAIPIIERYLTPQRVNQLIDAAFLAYLEQNPRMYKYCPTPDCSQIYRCDTATELHQCPSCFFKICGHCNEESHEAISCAEARVQRNPAEQERLNDEWIRQNNAKRCPECSALIIKGEGCNHISCRCGAHICWRCMGVFTATTIYPHMHSAHGGIHDADPIVPPIVAQPRAPVVPPRNLGFVPVPGARPQAGGAAVTNAQRLRAAQEEADRALARRLQLQEHAGGLYMNQQREVEQRRAQEQMLQIRRENLAQQRLTEVRERERALAEFAQAQEAERQRRVAATATATEDRGWCTIM